MGIGLALHLQGFVMDSHAYDDGDENEKKALLLIIVLMLFVVTFPRALVSVSHLRGALWTPCLSLYAPAARGECLLHSATDQHYGLRQFFMLVVAFLAGLGGYTLVRNRPSWNNPVWIAIPVVLLAHNGVGLIARIFDTTQILPGLYYNELGHERFTYLFSNPSWVWPYSVPGLSFSLWAALFIPSRKHRCIFGVFAAIAFLSIFMTQQRGGLLLLLITLTITGSAAIYRWAPVGTQKIMGSMLALSMALVVVALKVRPRGISTLASSVGLVWSRDPLSISYARLEIWRSAWKLFQRHPLAGMGYASWSLSITRIARESHLEYVFDSAHNHIVQLFTELGLVHGGLTLVILLWIARLAWRASKEIPGGSFLYATLLSGTLLAMLVQEVDYTKPVQIGFALAWGSLLGLPYTGSPGDNRKFNKWIESLSALWEFIESLFLRRIGLLFFGSGSVFLLAYLFLGPRGLYPFESTPEIPESPVYRWSSRNARIPVYGDGRDHSYAVFPVRIMPHIPQKWVEYMWNGKKIKARINKRNTVYVNLSSGSPFYPDPQWIRFENETHSDSKFFSAQVFYPPIYTSLAVFHTDGLEDLAIKPDRLEWQSRGNFFLEVGVETNRYVVSSKECDIRSMTNAVEQGGSHRLLRIRAKTITRLQGRCTGPGPHSLRLALQGLGS